MLHTLGGLHLEGAARQQAGPLVLLAYLALEGPQERRGVQELFFPGHADPAGRLRMMLHRIRLAAPLALETPGTRLQTLLPSDAAELFQVAERGEAAQVLSLYRGRFLDGVRLPGEQELEEWVFATRERLCARVRTCCLGLARAAALRGDTGLALTHAERAYLLPGAPEPGRDEARLLALLLTAAGSAFAADARTEAREAGPLPDQAADALDLLGEGVAPDRRRTEAGQGQDGPDIGDPGSSSAHHKEAEVEAADGRKTESGDAGLPALLGREDALAQIAACFAGGARLVTLLGQGGMGKTLLARHALQRAVQQASQGHTDSGQTGLLPGIMVDLSAVHDEAGVLPAIASATQARTAQLPDVAQSVRGYELLLLDNFEQVLSAAPQIAQLLELAPSLRMLVTSRERLHLSQEHVLPLEGLAVHASAVHAPDAGSVQPAWSDAARLFVRRATRAHLGFVPGDHRAGIEQVCALLRGVPLLIELASAWVRTLSPADIAAQLDGGRLKGAALSAPDLSQPNLDLLETQDRDVPARHASVRAVLEASWRRLNPQEQARLSKLAVFLSDFTPRAARQVCGATLSGLADLTDKSWLGAGGGSGRLSWHPLARAFVREASADWPGGGWKEALPDHAHAFAQGLNAERFQAETLGELLGEWPDIGQAARTLASLPGDWPTLTRLAREVPVWTEQVGNYASVAGLIGRVLDALPTGASPRAQLLRARAFMYVRMHRLQDAAADYRQAADLLMQSGDEKEVLTGLDALAVVHHQAGEYAQAEAIWLDILKRVEPLGLVHKQSYTLQYLALNSWEAGKLSEAEIYIRSALEVELKLLARFNRIEIYSMLGKILMKLKRKMEAHLVLSEGLNLARMLQAASQIPDLLNVMASNLFEMNRYDEAISLCKDALSMNQLDQLLLRANILDTLALCYKEVNEIKMATLSLKQSVQISVKLGSIPDILHCIYTYMLINESSYTEEDFTSVLNWLAIQNKISTMLRGEILKKIKNRTTASKKLPLLNIEVISMEAQRFCNYFAGKPSLTVPASF